MTALTQSPAWLALARHRDAMRDVHLRDLFAAAAGRVPLSGAGRGRDAAMAMPGSPTVRRRRLAAELRAIRESRGKSGDNVAAALKPLIAEGLTREIQLTGLKEIRQNLRRGSAADQVVFPTPTPFTARRRASILRVADAVLSFLGPEYASEAQQAESGPDSVESTSKQ